jgi:hypothetical protein
MARVAILAIIPVMALLAWRDWVLERQVRLLAVYDVAHHDYEVSRQISDRDDRIDDAMWKLMLGEAPEALEVIKDVARMPAATVVPQRAWRIAAAATCAAGDPPAEYRYWRQNDTRVRKFCQLNTSAAVAVKK